MLLVPSARAATWSENYGRGRIALERGRFRNAVAFFTQAIDQRPESKASARTYGANHIDYFPYLYRGIAYTKLGQDSLARMDLERESQAGEVFKGVLDTRAAGLLRRHLELLKGATSSPTSAAEKQPVPRSPTDSLFTIAAGYLGRGQMVKAKEIFLDVRKRNPAYPGLDEYLKKIHGVEQDVKKGIAAFLHGRYAEAIEVLAPAITSGADHPHAQAFLGCSYSALFFLSGKRDTEQHDKATQAFRRVKQIDPRYDLDRPFISPAIRDVFARTPAQ